jgi:hypothetical protein
MSFKSPFENENNSHKHPSVTVGSRL